ncbi:MAG: DHH family phosphoesterase [Spirochaetes bacterium]|nr:DHH family phosphoesterase [Spirochaetota bacterium]
MIVKKLDAIWDVIERHHDFVVVGHYNPDVDCVTSTLVAALLLERLGKRVLAVNSDVMHKKVSTVPFIDRVMFSYDANKIDMNGVLIVVDAGDINRIGHLKDYKHLFKEVIFIDHHVLRCEGGSYSYIDVTASSTVEIICDLFMPHAAEHIDKDIATLVYAGIAADTGFFCFRNTNERSLLTGAAMVRLGADIEAVDAMINRIMDEDDYKVLSKILLDIKVADGGKLAYTVQRKENGASLYADYAVSPIEYVMKLRNIRIGFVIREAENTWRLSMRSRGHADVRKITESFGGGGHVKAAGCEFEKAKYELKDIIALVLDRARKEIEVHGE